MNDTSSVPTSIDAFELEIKLQGELESWLKLPEPIPSLQHNDVCFAGSGDSFVAAMLADVFSNSKIQSMDPRDLYDNSHLIESRHLYVVSVSGNTIANIRAASLAKRLTVITADPHSRLAKLTDEIILSKPPVLGTSTAGSVTFLSNALVCMSLATEISIPKISCLLDIAKRTSQYVVSPSIFILGNLITFPIAMYCAAKFYEVLGYNVHYCRTEQFAHMELFAARSGDTVIIFERKTPYIDNLIHDLSTAGINVICPDLPKSSIDQVIYCTLFSQFITLYQARRAGLDECFFISSPNRQISNHIIYP